MIPYTPNLNHRQTDQHLLVPDVSRIPKPQKDMSKKDIRDHTYLSYLRYSDYSGCRSKNVDLRILYPMFTCRKIVCLKHGRHLAASLNSSLDIWLDDCGLQEMRKGEFLPFLGLTYIIWLWVKSMVFWWSPEKPVFWGDHPHQTWHSIGIDPSTLHD